VISFLALVLLAVVRLAADAVVLLCGEDAETRGEVATELVKHGAAPLVVASGGLHDPPHRIGAEAMASKLRGNGISPSALLVESTSTNTHEQATNVVALATEQ